MSRSFYAVLANATVGVLDHVQAIPDGDVFLPGIVVQFGGGFVVEQGHEGRAGATQDVGVKFVAARRGDDDEDIAVDEVREVVLLDGCFGGCGHTEVLCVEHVVLATRHCGGGVVEKMCGVEVLVGFSGGRVIDVVTA